MYAELGNIGDGARRGREGNGRVIHGKPNRFFTLYIVICHITFNFVKDLGNEEEVFDGSVIAEGGSENLVIEFSVPQNIDCWEEILHPS